LWYLFPRLKECDMLARYSDEAYFSGGEGNEGYSNYAAQDETLRKTFRRFLARLHLAGYSGGSLLEVGCGFGFLLQEAGNYYSRLAGTDFSAQAAARAGKYADEVLVGGIESLDTTAHFDNIISIGVIEHVYDPHAFIEGLLRHLKKGGNLVLATPDMGSAWRRLMGRHWPSFKIPEHVTYFDQQSLTRLLHQHGLVSVKRINFSHAFPLSLVLEKLGLRLGGWLGRLHMWLPATTLALAAKSE
ncbi:MAG: class I SAM-dependent methyltransferase, partial [Mariprofundus sp.]